MAKSTLKIVYSKSGQTKYLVFWLFFIFLFLCIGLLNHWWIIILQIIIANYFIVLIIKQGIQHWSFQPKKKCIF